jgi:hypothetical protein
MIKELALRGTREWGLASAEAGGLTRGDEAF